MALEGEARGRPLLDTSEFWRKTAAPSPLEARAGLVRVRRDGPPRTFEVPRAVLVIVVVDMGRCAVVEEEESDGAVGVGSVLARWE